MRTGSPIRENLCLLLCFFLYQPCVQGQIKENETSNITVAFSLENYDFRALFAEHRQQLGFDIRQARLTNSDLKIEMFTRIDANKLPDAIIMPSDTLGLEQARFSTIPEDWVLPELSKEALALAMVNSELKGIPLIAGNHLLLYYNKSLVPEPATSWQQLKAQQSVLKNAELIGWPYHEGFWILPFLGAYEALPYENGKLRFNLPDTQQAFKFLKQLRDENLLDTSCNYQCNQDKFMAQKLAYTINGVWSFNLYAEQLGENLGIALLPRIEGRKMRPYKAAHVLAFPADGVTGSKRESLKKLALLMQSNQIQHRLWREKRALPTNKNVEKRVLAEADSNTSMIFQQLADAPPMPNEEVMAIVWEAIIIGFNRFDGGAMTAEQASNYMQYIATKSREEL